MKQCSMAKTIGQKSKILSLLQ